MATTLMRLQHIDDDEIAECATLIRRKRIGAAGPDKTYRADRSSLVGNR